MPPTVDRDAQLAALERQLVLLLPVRQHLQVEVAPRWIVVDDEWSGEAARAAADTVRELERRVALAADEVDDLVRIVRLEIGARS